MSQSNLNTRSLNATLAHWLLAAGLLCGRSEDGSEALRAAMEKRPARFIGR